MRDAIAALIDRVGGHMDWQAFDDRSARLDVEPAGQHWDREISAEAYGDDAWCPVYVALVRPVEGRKGSARRLRDLILKSPTVSAGQDTFNTLALLERDGGLPVFDGRERMFVSRPAKTAASAIADAKGPLATVLRIGPPTASGRFAPPRPDPARARSVTLPDDAPFAQDPAGHGDVAIGIIDDAIGVQNERFRDASGRTRVRRFWKMGTDRARPPGGGTPSLPAGLTAILAAGPEVSNGLALTGGQLDALFQTRFAHDERALYAWIEAQANPPPGPPVGGLRQTMTKAVSHGTFVTDLAAGDDPGGPAILAAELPLMATAETSGRRIEVAALQALLQLFDWADHWRAADTGVGPCRRIPLVVNLSFGFSGGPKDGTGFLESQIAHHVAIRNRLVPTAVCIAAGNDYRAQLHASTTIKPGTTAALALRLQPQDRTPSFLEIRVPEDFCGTLSVTPPHGPTGRIVFPGTALPTGLDLVMPAEQSRGKATVARIYVQREGTRTLVTLALARTQDERMPRRVVPAGSWDVTLTNSGSVRCTATLDVERDDTPRGFPRYGRQSYLETPDYGAFEIETRTYTDFVPGAAVSRKGTLSAVATGGGPGIYVVGAANDTRRAGPIAVLPARYTSSGPDGRRIGPDLSAIAEDGFGTPGRLGAGTFSGSAAIWGGTSAAAPQVARAVARHIARTGALPAVADIGPAPLPADAERLGPALLPRQATPGRLARRPA